RLLRLLGSFQSLVNVVERRSLAPAASFQAADRAAVERAIHAPHFLYGRFVDEIVVPHVMASRPDMIGISITYPRQMLPALITCGALRRVATGIRIILGGAYLSTVVETFLERPEVRDLWDFLVDGEGETAITRLAQMASDAGSLEDVPNLIYQADGRAIRSKKQRYEEDIHTLATPDFAGLNLASYLTPEIVFLLPVARGCYMRCTFCPISYATT